MPSIDCRLDVVVIVLGFVVACGAPDRGPDPSRPGPGPTRVDKAAPVAAESVEVIATRFGQAALSGDRATALALTLTFEDMTKLTKTAAEKGRESWDEAVADYLDRMAGEGGEHAKAKVVGARIVKTMTLTPAKDEKVTRDVDVAVVQLVIEEPGQDAQARGVPLIFLRTDAGWKFSPKQ